MRLLVLCLLSSLAHATSIFEPVRLISDSCTIAQCVPIVLGPDVNPLVGPFPIAGDKYIYIDFHAFQADTDYGGTLSIDGYGSFVQSGHSDTTHSCFPAPPCEIGMAIGWKIPKTIYHPRQATVNFNYGGIESDTYRFQIVEPVPEPSSILLAVSGLLGLGGLKLFSSNRRH